MGVIEMSELIKSLQSTLSLLGIVVSEWKAREEARKRKEEADAMVVKYKVKSHSMDTQEEIDEAKFRATFPDYFKMYSDLDDVCPLSSYTFVQFS